MNFKKNNTIEIEIIFTYIDSPKEIAKITCDAFIEEAIFIKSLLLKLGKDKIIRLNKINCCQINPDSNGDILSFLKKSKGNYSFLEINNDEETK